VFIERQGAAKPIAGGMARLGPGSIKARRCALGALSFDASKKHGLALGRHQAGRAHDTQSLWSTLT